jgi:hypothetical protein
VVTNAKELVVHVIKVAGIDGAPNHVITILFVGITPKALVECSVSARKGVSDDAVTLYVIKIVM